MKIEDKNRKKEVSDRQYVPMTEEAS